MEYDIQDVRIFQFSHFRDINYLNVKKMIHIGVLETYIYKSYIITLAFSAFPL